MALNLWHQSLNEGKSDVTMYNIIIHGLCSAGKVEDALQFCSEMEQWNRIPNLVTHKNRPDIRWVPQADRHISVLLCGYRSVMWKPHFACIVFVCGLFSVLLGQR
jgi:pentatricopeptide repeat protein